MLLTVTPNPSLDLLFTHDALVWDDANRMDDPRRRPGGQGINVARACRALGGGAAAVTLLGGRTGAEMAAALDAEGTPCRSVQVEGETRTFVAVRETGTGRSLLLNARGPGRSEADAAALLDLAGAAIAELHPRWVAGCGSLPRGFPADFYASLAIAARRAGARAVTDCDGEPLRAAASAGCDLLVPNQHEAGRLLGAPIDGVADAATAADALRARFGADVAITLGPAGAVLACAAGTFHAAAPPIADGSAVGAGDVFLAALLLHDEPPGPATLRRAVAAGSATLLARGPDLVRAEPARALEARVSVALIQPP